MGKQTSNTDRILEEAREKGEQLIPPHLRQKVRLEVIENISQLDTSLLDLEQFTEKVVNLLRDKFGLYFVGLHLLDKKGYGLDYWLDQENWVNCSNRYTLGSHLKVKLFLVRL